MRSTSVVPVAVAGDHVEGLRVQPGDLLLRVALGQDYAHLAVVASPNVFIAASAQAAAPSPIAPSDSDNTAINWSTSDQNIALVNEFGMVVGRAPGNAVVGSELDGRWAFTAVKDVTKLAASTAAKMIRRFGIQNPRKDNPML